MTRTALRWRRTQDDPDEVVLQPPIGHKRAGAAPELLFSRLTESKVVKNRLHLDLRAAPGLQGDERMSALEAEAERLVGLGGSRVRRFEPEPPMSAGHVLMADPEGNEFCLD